MQHFESLGIRKKVSTGILSTLPTKVKQSISYQQLTQTQRYKIHARCDVGLSRRQIANALGINDSIVKREVRRYAATISRVSSHVAIIVAVLPGCGSRLYLGFVRKVIFDNVAHAHPA
ncbi:helix-turn-helix domain-containing protein [Cobetia sp. L2A1]|uniref:helix-turn-helix domain-containing protein n=1 Tax=Cobetia sp. L2A1 TaxID=2686360 RepID=UPI00131E5304|nr:helix-turn-helix domain-containing protein [Cobetia sp. L2A1]